MIVDTSVIMAILLREPEGPDFLERLSKADAPRISAGSWIEAATVVVRREVDGGIALLERFARDLDLRIEPVTVEQAWIGQAAYQKYGRGTQHPARLNFGDCFAYALAKATDEPLLFKGDDFGKTDVTIA